jgi:hypothetical protein
MWDTNTYWFDVSLITGITAFGSIYFGHFELHTPRWRRVLKLIFFIALAVTITATAGRMWTFVLIGVMVVAVVVIHGFVLPSKGINGITGEPREKYYRFRGWEKYL